MQIAMYITTGQPQYCRFVYIIDPQIARFMGPTKSPPRPGRPQMGPMLAHGPCYQGLVSFTGAQSFSWVLSNEQTSLICMFYGTYTPTCLQNVGGGGGGGGGGTPESDIASRVRCVRWSNPSYFTCASKIVRLHHLLQGKPKRYKDKK